MGVSARSLFEKTPHRTLREDAVEVLKMDSLPPPLVSTEEFNRNGDDTSA